MESTLEAVLEEVGERLRLHAGGIELVDADEATGVVRVRFAGTCRHCPLSTMTLKHGVEAALRDRLPWFREVIAVE